ncbi:ATP-binding protein [Vibrio sp. SCSIO 43137]|uniref:ATP-binding protein n=1 Tax=Vibrio sp. SCSIO 43137 TaxID=3021011 RepID=UPI0023078C63|nr:ATP-binding protein [Vibrio sp. SCSIO 43137]WCE30642.1 ATP-binding protein [Vibrio sp. SCSIO 43137]
MKINSAHTGEGSVYSDIYAKVAKVIPRSLVSRTLWLTLLSVIFAQLIATAIWYTQSKYRELEGLKSTSISMANNFASTANFFQSLPQQYRHIVLDQLRNMGGTRFFVSFNEEEINIDPVPDNEMRKTAVEVFSSILIQKLPGQNNIKVQLSRPENLHVLTNDTLLSDLPKSWAHYTLSLEPLNPPILVVQIELAPSEWLYIAALLPSPYVMLQDEVLSNQQVFFILFITALLMTLTYFMIRRQVKPLKRLAQAANALSMDIDQPPLTEEGASELVTATRAFNRMQMRLGRHIEDRERLFSAISHDLKTPITRLRIRSELIEDEQRGIKFNRDLDELELMVKGALQTVKDTDIHENLEEMDLLEMIAAIAEHHNSQERKVTIDSPESVTFLCKPLALKRCLSNIINNGVKYGDRVRVTLSGTTDSLDIVVRDQGPGIPENMMDEVFKPYFRLAKDEEGHGLGMGIAKSIAHAHGGDLTIKNQIEGGLMVTISLPKASLS